MESGELVNPFDNYFVYCFWNQANNIIFTYKFL